MKLFLDLLINLLIVVAFVGLILGAFILMLKYEAIAYTVVGGVMTIFAFTIKK